MRTTIKKDKAGNRIVREDDGRLGVINAKGGYVNPKDSASFLRKHGFSTKKQGGKLYVKKTESWF